MPVAWEIKQAMTCPLAVLVTFFLASFASAYAPSLISCAFFCNGVARSLFWSLAAFPQMLVNTNSFLRASKVGSSGNIHMSKQGPQ